MSIIISTGGKGAVRVEKAGFKLEKYLQQYIENNPQCLPLNEIKEKAELLVVVHEFLLSTGVSIDILGFDGDGDIYIIETKLNRNPEAKREVIAQVLEYGAVLWEYYSNAQEFIDAVAASLEKQGKKDLAKLLVADPSRLDKIKENVENGIFKFIIPMDTVPTGLKKLIQYLNEKSKFNVYAVEMNYYEHGGQEIIVPHLFGAEDKRKASNIPNKRNWDESSFFEDTKSKLGKREVDAIHQLYMFSKKTGNITWGKGPSIGTFNVKFAGISSNQVYSVQSDGRIYLNLERLSDNDEVCAFKEKLCNDLKEMKLFDLTKGYPTASSEKWVPVADELIKVLAKNLLKK